MKKTIIFCFRSQVPIDVLRIFHAWAQPEVSEVGGGRSQVTIDVLRLPRALARPEVLAKVGGRHLANFVLFFTPIV